MKAEAKKITETSKMDRDISDKTTTLEYEKNLADLEIQKTLSLAQIESKKVFLTILNNLILY